jgi:regulator of replication initiation timing
MNANEQADALDWVCENHLVGIGDADFKAIATMLRQQQAEIEALKSGLDRAVELYTDKAIENEALKELLANEGIVVGHDYLNDCIATMRKAQEK